MTARPLTTREKGAGIAALGGAAPGGLLAAPWIYGSRCSGWGALGLRAGALIGNQLQGQEMAQQEQQRRIEHNKAEINRQRREIQKLDLGTYYRSISKSCIFRYSDRPGTSPVIPV